MEEKILCYHHNDMDGRSAGAVVAHYYGITDETNFHEVNYDGNLPDIEKASEFDKVIFVDYSFTEDTCHVLRDLIKKNVNVIWVDHHDSSIELCKKYPEFEENIDCTIKKGLSGAALAYMRFFNCDYENLPYFLKLVSDYDCWIMKYDPLSSYFKLGIDMVDNGPFAQIWQDLFNNPNSEAKVNAICETGKIIKMYVDKDNRDALEEYSFETEILGRKCLAINKEGNSWVFGDKIKEYPIVSLFRFDGEKYTYSIYTDSDDIDCSKIAEKFGGGGHRKASGFSTKELIFKKKK